MVYIESQAWSMNLASGFNIHLEEVLVSHLFSNFNKNSVFFPYTLVFNLIVRGNGLIARGIG